MYVPLSKFEKGYFLSQIDVLVNISADKINIGKEMPMTINIRSVNFVRSILTATLIKYSDFMVVRNLKSAPYNQLEHYRNLYEVVCYEAINKIVAFAKVYGHEEVRIYTNEDIIVEQLFNHNADLLKLKNSSINEIMACLKLK